MVKNHNGQPNPNPTKLGTIVGGGKGNRLAILWDADERVTTCPASYLALSDAPRIMQHGLPLGCSVVRVSKSGWGGLYLGSSDGVSGSVQLGGDFNIASIALSDLREVQ